MEPVIATVEYCACNSTLETPYELRTGKCYECEAQDERMKCWCCRRDMHWSYTDGRPQFCSDQCENRYYNELAYG